MSRALDANYNATMVREGDQIGGLLPVTDTTLRRLMPEGNAAAVIADNDRQLNIGNLRSDTPEIADWNLIILNAGYPAKHRIKSYENGIVTLHKSLELHKGLQALGAAIEWVIFPTLDFPLGITYRPDAGSSTLEIGVVKDNLWRPALRPYAVLEAGQMLVLHTQQIQKIFIQASAASADDQIMWGESYIA